MDGLTLVVLVAVAMVIGLAGVVLPALPGVPLMWIGALVYGIVAGFGTIGIAAMAAITVLTALGVAAGLVLPQRAGQASGASSGTLTFAFLVGLVGFFVIPVLGFPIGAVLGVLVAQFRETGEWGAAWDSTIAVLKGFGAGVIAELGAGIGIVVVWVAWVVTTGGVDGVI